VFLFIGHKGDDMKKDVPPQLITGSHNPETLHPHDLLATNQ